MNKQKKAVVFAAFWGQVGNVGTNRIERFVRWLSRDGYYVVVVRAGSSDGNREQWFGLEVTVRDPVGIYRDTAPGMSSMVSHRKPSKLRRSLAYWLFNPDPAVLWARAASRSAAVRKAVEGSSFILSSNPPESGHLGAWRLSRRLRVPHVVDMRDGWLDEPLRPLLRTSAFRRWSEGRAEKKILGDAAQIMVTSDPWKRLLCSRYPKLTERVHVLTNAYPLTSVVVETQPSTGREVELVHAGQFSGSDGRRTPALLLTPLLSEIKGGNRNQRGVVKLYGPLTADELNMVDKFRPQYESVGWKVECPGRIARKQLLNILGTADGLLMLSTSFAGLPAKLFEYIPTRKPMFVAAKPGSAAWAVCDLLPQAVRVEPGSSQDAVNIEGRVPFYLLEEGSVPPQFSEEHLSKLFYDVLGELS